MPVAGVLLTMAASGAVAEAPAADVAAGEAATPATAQDAGPPPPVVLVDATPPLQEVVVTAGSLLPASPGAADLLDAGTLEQSQVDGLPRLQALVPTLSVSAMGGRATPHYVSLRGYTNPWSMPESAVAVYLDGVPFSDFYALDQRLFDIESIEVRRGPQGSAYGLNGEAGVIDISTRQPDAKPRAWARLSGGAPESHAIEAGASGELAPRLRGSVAVSRDGSEGYIDNLAGHQPYNGQWGRDLHGRLRWQAGEGAELGLMLLDREVDDQGGELYLPVDRARFNQQPTLQGKQLGRFDQAIDHDGWNRLDTSLAALTAQWKGAGLQWSAVGSWRESDVATSTDYDLSPQPWFVMESHYRIEEGQAELRAASGGETGWRWFAGVSLDQREQKTLRLFHAGPGNPWSLPVGAYTRTDATQPDFTTALFGESGWRFGADRRWGLTAGARVEQDQRRLEYGPNALAPGVTRERRDTQWLPKLAADVRLTPAQTAYASLAMGGKAGGFNPGVFDGSRAGFGPECALAAELGLNGGIGADFDYTLAAFHNRIRHYQDMVIDERQFTLYVANVPLASTQGLEAQLAWRLQENWSVEAMLGSVRARYEDYLIDPARNVRLDGHSLQQVPRWNGRLATRYAQGAWWAQLALNGAGRYAINAYDGLTGSLREESIEGYAALGLHAGWHGDRWSLQLDGENLTDRRYFPNATYGFSSTAGYSGAVGAVAPGRTVGLSLRREL